MATSKPPTYHRVWIKIRRSKPTRWRRGWKRNPTWREQIRLDMKWAVKNTAQIHYKQVRPFAPDAIRYRKLPITTDCSGSTTMLYRAAGLPDPNGAKYNGTGYTGTLREHLPKITLADAGVGDLIIYGRGSGVHVVVIDVPHPTNPVVFSHGQESGPFYISHAREVAAHGSVFTVHSGEPK